MELKNIQCPICGSNELTRITPDGAPMYKCNCCNSKLEDTSVLREYEKICAKISTTVEEKVDEAILREKSAVYYNLRNMLWKTVKANYMNDDAIVDLTTKILTIVPDDSLAQFFSCIYDPNNKNVAKYLKDLDVRKNAMNMEIIFEFLIKSLKPDYITPTSLLLEKCHEIILTGEKWQTYKTALEKEASKIEDGMYDLNITRDVFLAYSGKDIDTVNDLMEDLEKDGLTCFAAFRNLQRGQGSARSYEKDIEKAIDNCKIFLFVSSVNSRNTGCGAYKQEINYVKQKEMKLHPEYRTYEQIPDKYKMLRIEYRLDDTLSRLVDRELKSFFYGLTRAENYDQLIDKLIECRDQLAVAVDDERGLSKEERKRFEKEKARLVAEKENLEAERALFNSQKALEKERLKVQKRQEKRALAEKRRDDFKEKMQDAFSSSAKGIGTAFKYSAKAVWIALKAIFSFLATSWAWFIITPLLLSLGAIITRAAVGNFILPDAFMLVVYSICAAWTLGGTIVTLCKKRNIAAYIIGHVIFSAFASMILFGGIIAPKWDFITATVSAIIAVLVLFLLYGVDVSIISEIKTLKFFLLGVEIVIIISLLIPKTLTVNHPSNFIFLASLLMGIVSLIPLIINTFEGENIFTYFNLPLLLPFILFGGYLHIAVRIIFILLSVVILFLSSENLLYLLDDCGEAVPIVTLFSLAITIVLGIAIFGDFILPDIGLIILVSVTLIIVSIVLIILGVGVGVGAPYLSGIGIILLLVSTVSLLFGGVFSSIVNETIGLLLFSYQ